MWKEAVRTGMVSLARDSEEVMRAAERRHPGTSMEMTCRSEGLAYVRRFGDPTARALVDELEQENSRLREAVVQRAMCVQPSEPS